MQPQNLGLEKSRFGYFAAGVWFVITAAIVVRFTQLALGEYQMSFMEIVMVDLLLSTPSGLLIFILWANMDVRITESHIAKRSFLGWVVVKWTDVINLDDRGPGISMQTANLRLSISPYVFKKPDLVRAFIRAKVFNKTSTLAEFEGR